MRPLGNQCTATDVLIGSAKILLHASTKLVYGMIPDPRVVPFSNRVVPFSNGVVPFSNRV